jgi:hypothetical protein
MTNSPGLVSESCQKKRGIFSIEKNYGAFNSFLRNILHLTFKKKRTLHFSQFSIFFYLWNINTQSCVITYTIMCNYLNKYTKWCSLHSVYIFMKNVQKMWKSWGQLPSLLLKIEGGGQNSFAPLFGIKFKKKKTFLL